VNLQAYDFYMRGKFLIEKRNKTDLLVARELFQQAVTKTEHLQMLIQDLQPPIYFLHFVDMKIR
jgi:hypothetical protein